MDDVYRRITSTAIWLERSTVFATNRTEEMYGFTRYRLSGKIDLNNYAKNMLPSHKTKGDVYLIE